MHNGTSANHTRLGGVGITFQQDAANPRILQVYKLKLGSPASRSGKIELGDRLREIDGIDVTQGNSLREPSIPGEEGTIVELTFDRMYPLPVKRYVRFSVRLIREAAFHPDKLVAPNFSNQSTNDSEEQDQEDYKLWDQEKQFLLLEIQKLQASREEMKLRLKDMQNLQSPQAIAFEKQLSSVRTSTQLNNRIYELEQEENERNKQCLKLAKEVVRLRTDLHRSQLNVSNKDISDLERDIAMEKERIAGLQRQLSMLESR